jgi:hypothetical protein
VDPEIDAFIHMMAEKMVGWPPAAACALVADACWQVLQMMPLHRAHHLLRQAPRLTTASRAAAMPRWPATC